MQHRYVPDLGDFSKFAVIDALSQGGTLRTSLVWYLVDPHEVGDTHKNDGKHTGYLTNDRQGLADCHPQLYERFQAIHRAGIKHIGTYAHHNVLPNVSYFSEPLSYADEPKPSREGLRAGWLDRAMAVAQGSDLAVLDPDNGLGAEHLSIDSTIAVKYATLDECAAFYQGGQRALVVYQHSHRQGTVAQQADKALHRLAAHMDVPREQAFALRFHRGTSRCYLVVPSRKDRNAMRGRAQAMIASAWGKRGHFSLID